jgi:cobalt-zinc-cadmium efflux system membrane fusion protein
MSTNKIIIFLLATTLMACGSKTNTEQKSSVSATQAIVELTDAQLKNSSIETGKLEQKSISSILKLNGKIDVPPQNMVSVSMPLGGYLKTTKLLPGMHVSKGEVIATMEDQQYIQLQEDYLITKSKLNYLEGEYLRQKELNKTKASSDKVLQQTEMEYKSQKIAMSALAEKLKLINVNPNTLSENNLSKSVSVFSPISGFVSKVNVNIGKYLNPSDVMFELVNPEDIHLNLNIFEKDLDKLSIGQKVVAFTNNQPDKKHACEIILISKDLSTDGMAEVHSHFESYDKTLLPGMYMNAEIKVLTNKALVIATDGIVTFEGKHYVFEVVGDKKYAMREVTLQNAEDGFTQITFLEAEEISEKTFVTKGAYTLLMKMKNTEEE